MTGIKNLIVFSTLTAMVTCKTRTQGDSQLKHSFGKTFVPRNTLDAASFSAIKSFVSGANNEV